MLALPTPRLQQGVLALFVWLSQLVGEHRVKAGNCWLQQGSNGRCQVLYQSGMTRDACCRSARLGSAWTEEDVPNSTLFKWMIFNGGAPNCIPCKDSCDSVDCGPGKRCKMTKRNKPRCVCSPNCANTTARGPVCGSDGKSYRDQCSLLRARCRNQPDLQAQYHGRCRKSCRGVRCPGASTCVIDQTNAAYCVTCNLLCPETTKPEQVLCGNDAVTYPSPCHLRRATCLLGKSIGVAYSGPCIEASSCADIACVAGKRCLWDEESGRGRCVECTEEPCPEERPGEVVCASDNNSYPSECSMRKAACDLGRPLEVKHQGSCNCLQ